MRSTTSKLQTRTGSIACKEGPGGDRGSFCVSPGSWWRKIYVIKNMDSRLRPDHRASEGFLRTRSRAFRERALAAGTNFEKHGTHSPKQTCRTGLLCMLLRVWCSQEPRPLLGAGSRNNSASICTTQWPHRLRRSLL